MKIQHLKLFCANLEQQKHFYTQKFNFELVHEDEGEFTLKTGDSELTFCENKMQNSYYHFAFNIPVPALDKAIEWVREKVDILTDAGVELHEFTDWKAKAFYFLDPACNIVEFIARDNLKKRFSGKFSEKSIMNISEVGLPVFQVSEAYKLLNKHSSIEKFDCNESTFCACGDDEGLFIIVDKAEKNWFPSDSRAKAYPLEAHIKVSRKAFKVSNSAEGVTISS